MNWIIRADNFVQTQWINWKFLRAEFNQNTVNAQATLPKPADHATWDLDTFFIRPIGSTSAADNEPIDVVEYDKIKSTILDVSAGHPSTIIIMPDNSLKFSGIPDGAYPIIADYYKTPVMLAANTDVSLIPPEFHNVILGRALILYANFENAAEIKTQGTEIYSEYLMRLENKELPNQNYSRYRTGGGFQVMPE